MKVIILRPLTIREILAWCDECKEATGRWPNRSTPGPAGPHGETWPHVDRVLREGGRGLPGGSSLAQLLAEHRGVRHIHRLPPLTVVQILKWADEHFARNGAWPTKDSGTIPKSGGEKWSAIDTALASGARELPGGSSLARLLAQYRGVRNRKALPHLSIEGILEWIDEHHARTGQWPTARSGPIHAAPGETWMAVAMALSKGQRGLPGGSSLALLLADYRGVRNGWTRPDLTIPQILAWADAWHARTGLWPNLESGPIPEAPGETWCAVNQALRRGLRSLPGGTSLAKLLAAERGVRNQTSVPPLHREKILAWAGAHRRRTGDWPTKDSGPIPEAPGETWSAVDAALRDGTRHLAGGSSLARLLATYRGRKNDKDLPRLTYKQILAWADAHFQRTGEWPNVNSGPVHGVPGERWDLIDNALRVGGRQLPGGSSLLRLLVRKRGVRNPLQLPPLCEAQIVAWARLQQQRTGELPRYKSGAVADAPGETWAAIDWALRYGKRTLPGGSSLAKLLARECAGGPAAEDQASQARSPC